MNLGRATNSSALESLIWPVRPAKRSHLLLLSHFVEKGNVVFFVGEPNRLGYGAAVGVAAGAVPVAAVVGVAAGAVPVAAAVGMVAPPP